MLGWFRTRCPIRTRDKAWVEWRMLWLAGRFGLDRLRSARVILPTDEFFPDPYRGDEADARVQFDRMCGYMGVPPESVGLEIVDDNDMPGAAGLYEMRAKSNICVARSNLETLPRMLATFAHELAHERLLKGGHLTGDTADHEQITDLLPVVLGTGLFLANATVEFTSGSDGTVSYWSISRRGYLSSITLGYALAVFAYVRGEDRPPWAAHLRTDAAETLRAGLAYLRKTGDCLLHPDRSSQPWVAPPTNVVVERLADPSPTVRSAALWDIAEHGLAGVELLPAVERCLRDRDPDVCREAIRTLGAFGQLAVSSIPRLLDAAWSDDPELRVAVADALGDIGVTDRDGVQALAALVGDGSLDVAVAAAGGLARIGPAAGVATPQLLVAVEAAAAVTDLTRLQHLVAALWAVDSDAKVRLREYFIGRDPEVLRLALGVLRDLSAGGGG